MRGSSESRREDEGKRQGWREGEGESLCACECDSEGHCEGKGTSSCSGESKSLCEGKSKGCECEGTRPLWGRLLHGFGSIQAVTCCVLPHSPSELSLLCSRLHVPSVSFHIGTRVLCLTMRCITRAWWPSVLASRSRFITNPDMIQPEPGACQVKTCRR